MPKQIAPSARPLDAAFSFIRSIAILALMLRATIGADQTASAQQNCPPPPPIGWIPCGECRGDLNGDGLLNSTDLIVFEIYREQTPQNLCADFNVDGVVNQIDADFLKWILNPNPLFNACYKPACRPECGDPANRSCFIGGNPGDLIPGGCNDAACCRTVCLFDPLCCADLWDNGCAAIAQNICLPNVPDTRTDAGDSLRVHTYDLTTPDCQIPHATPGCVDSRCSSLVCIADPTCCRVAWDAACADLARVHCQSPCTNILVQEEVCLLNPQCCSTGNWDITCALAAMTFLASPNNPGISALPRHFLLAPVPEPTRADPDPMATALETFRVLLCNIDGVYCAPAGDLAFYTDISNALSVISINYPECVTQFNGSEWDAGCAQVAARLIRRPVPGNAGLGSCLLPHPGLGCDDAFCSQLVCNLDPACCTIVWDTDCVRIAGNQCILVPSRDLAFSDVQLTGAVAINDGAGLGCGTTNSGSCCFQSYTPFCRDAECCQLVCGYDAYCCEVRWDELCATVATAGCETIGEQCGCGAKFIDFGPIGRSCFEARPLEAQFAAGCEDADCCNTVCYVDPFCCEIRWDQVCADGAEQLCAQVYPLCGEILAGSCYIPRKNPYCDDESCCESVCIVEPFCCNDAWDENCVALAQEVCTECGDVYAGSCLSPHPGPACSDQDCCEEVCSVDPFCCLQRWDGSCAVAASFYPDLCGRDQSCGNPQARNCFVESFTPGCSDTACCKSVCEDYDAWCCEVRWDAVCAAQAFTVCDLPFNAGGRDPCNEIHGTPGCNDENCTAAVCSIPGLEFCCQLRWDTDCVNAAAVVCIGLYECPGVGDCEKSKSTPMCDDAACCNAVCTIDPLCCSVKWDNSCAVLAINLCRVPSSSGWECPCEGSCFEARPLDAPKPGCDDVSCCAAICNVDELCCLENWDEVCAGLANFYCGSDLQCGSFSTGGCLESSETPFCDDAACCSAVCAIDPSCCTNRWDSFCVATALQRCRQGCGLETAGSCFSPHLSPGCSDSECCVTICDDDPVCCTTVWDSVCATAALDGCDAPECGDFAAGDCCNMNFSPSCNDKRCCDDVCAKDPSCCDTTWDSVCVELARQSTRCGCGANWDCGDPCAGSCCLPNGTPKCDDESCCDAVCADDSYCCDVEWDLVCAGMALTNDDCTGLEDACPVAVCGDPDAGDCCFPNGTPSCNDENCCNDVCDDDPVCCDLAWDGVCAQIAAEICSDLCDSDLECGSSDTGPCNVPHDGPYCADTTCCELVCQYEPFCCLGDWDEFCVLLADTYCAP